MGEARVPMDDAAVRERVVRLDELLDRLEALPGPTTALALETVETLAAIYGEALARVMERAASMPALQDALVGDELVGHLLLLHDLHPVPVEERVAEALEEVRPYLHSHGGNVELAGVADGVARVRLSGSCSGCASSTATLESAVADAVLAAAPELYAVEQLHDEPAQRPRPAFVPLSAVTRLAVTPSASSP